MEFVKLSFVDESLASICNSKLLITAQWGDRGLSVVGRRLSELTAVDGANVRDLPATIVTLDDGDFTSMSYDDGEVIIVGIPTEGEVLTKDMTRADGFIIHSVTVKDAT